MEETSRGGAGMSQKDKRRHLFKVFLRSKALFACFSIVLSLLLVVGSTYAWITSTDQRLNRTETSRRKLSARIDEDFSRVFKWAPGTTQKKSVRVRNDGEMPALVRLKLEESFVSFEVDTTDNHREDANPDNNINGNANLKSYPTPSAVSINDKDTDTWVKDNTYEINADKHYKADFAITNQLYLPDRTREAPLSAIVIDFNSGKIIDDINEITGKKDYWYYQEGYFYYSEILEPGEETEPLMASVSLDAKYTNQYKGALYKLVPEMEAHDITKLFLTDWEIDGTDAEKVYKDNEKLPYMKTSSEGGAG